MDTTAHRIARMFAAATLAAMLLVAGNGVAEPVELTIVHFNDLDRMEERGGQGGFARSPLITAARRAKPPCPPRSSMRSRSLKCTMVSSTGSATPLPATSSIAARCLPRRHWPRCCWSPATAWPSRSS